MCMCTVSSRFDLMAVIEMDYFKFMQRYMYSAVVYLYLYSILYVRSISEQADWNSDDRFSSTNNIDVQIIKQERTRQVQDIFFFYSLALEESGRLETEPLTLRIQARSR